MPLDLSSLIHHLLMQIDQYNFPHQIPLCGTRKTDWRNSPDQSALSIKNTRRRWTVEIWSCFTKDSDLNRHRGTKHQQQKKNFFSSKKSKKKLRVSRSYRRHSRRAYPSSTPISLGGGRIGPSDTKTPSPTSSSAAP